MVGSLVGLWDQQNVSRFSELDLNTMRAKCDADYADVREIFGTAQVVKAYESEGASGIKQLAAQLKHWKKALR